MKEVVQLLVCFWEICMPVWFLEKWTDKRMLRWQSAGMWYVCMGVSVMLLYIQRTDILYSRWYLIFEIITITPLMAWKFQIKRVKAFLYAGILYESIYAMDLLLIMSAGYRYGTDPFERLLGGITWQGNLIHITGRMIALAVLYVLYRKRDKILPLCVRNWRIGYFILPAEHASLIVCDSYFYDRDQIAALENICGLFLIYMGLLTFLFLLYFKKSEENEKRIAEERAAAAEQRYQERLAGERERDILLHDMKNHMVVLDGLIRENETKRALDYIEGIRRNYQAVRSRQETGNIAVDTILESKTAKAREEGIRIKVLADDLADSFVTDRDWCSILANLLDNAVEACREAGREGWIEIRLENRPFGVALNMRNNCKAGPVTRGIPDTTKKAGRHGIGLRSVRCTAEKYQGTLICEQKDGVFCVNVILYR